MVQTIVGKIYVISLFVNLYVLFQVQTRPSHSSIRFYRTHTREARANLADLVNFPRLANTRRESDGTWAVAQNEYEKTDPVRCPRLFLILRRTYLAFHVRCHLGTKQMTRLSKEARRTVPRLFESSRKAVSYSFPIVH